MKSKKLNDCLNRFHVAMPMPRDQKERRIPEAVLEAKTKKAEQPTEKQIKLEKDLEDENGGWIKPKLNKLVQLRMSNVVSITTANIDTKNIHHCSRRRHWTPLHKV
ncbi:Nucleolar GTP-binding protein 1 [Forsythia ovata]|uniref:Nucleolar GTP-binding protein 1 n=1 Tax=Forsythia ovata TaxID=205694 RepID=A0ABD1RQ46_9LAMI